jgi:hypothetical protein
MANPNPDEIDLSESDFYSNSVDDQNANPSNSEDLTIESESAALAQALGFTAFGAQPDDGDHIRPNKKRRFNPLADAAVIATPQQDEQPPTTILTASRVQIHPSTATDEINYDDSSPNPNLDSHPHPQSRSRSGTPTSFRGDSRGRGRGGNRGGSARGGGGGGHGHGGHVHNPTWYVDYYDTSFNQNPWEALEKRLGLQAVGSWLARGAPSAGGNAMREGGSRGVVGGGGESTAAAAVEVVAV